MIVQKLNFTLDIDELRQYYNTLLNDYDYLRWEWNREKDTIVDQWQTAVQKDPANLLTQGWAIQSNLKDLSIPCPPWNISTHETVEYRNTVLSFGVIEKLQQLIPYGYRWSVSLQPPSGKVSLHSDQKDELTVWIPIYTSGPVITFVTNKTEHNISLEADGSAYLLDTTIPHYTLNSSNCDRVAIIFRLNNKYKKDLIETHF